MANYIYTNDGVLHNADALEHGFKYVKKVPDGKGGWKYYYKNDNFGNSGTTTKRADSVMYEKTSGKRGSKYGSYVHTDSRTGKRTYVNVHKRNQLLSSTKTWTDKDGNTHRVESDGALEQMADAGVRKAKKLAKKTKKKARDVRKWIAKKLKSR